MAKKTDTLTPKTNEGLKSISLDIENFKNITKTHIDIGGKSLIFLGPNGSGKSSLIQALTGSLDKKQLPEKSIKKGEEKAKITHVIGGTIGGEQKEYTIELFFTPGDQSGRMVVTNEKGEAQKSPAGLIKSLIGAVSFDVTKWANESKEKKINTIKSLTGCGVEVDIITKEIDEAKVKMKAKKERAEELDGALKNNGFTPEEIELYSTPAPLEVLNAEMQGITVAMENYNKMINHRNNFSNSVEESSKKIEKSSIEINRLNMEIQRLQGLIKNENDSIQAEIAAAEKTNTNIATCDAWFAVNVKPNAEDINARMSAAIAHNVNNTRIGDLSLYQREMVKCMQEVDVFKADIEKAEKKRSDLISNSQLPIEGLTFTDTDIFLDGLPLEDGQINTAKLWSVGVQIAKALNPTYKGIFLHDGSLLDSHTLKTLVDEIERDGYFAIIEMVAPDGEELEIKFTETALK